MRLSASQLRLLVERVLRESAAGSYAAWVKEEEDGGVTAAVWEPAKALPILQAQGGSSLRRRVADEAAKASCVGIVQVKPSEEAECWGAWEIGYTGKAPDFPRGIIYPLAYALSPTGRLVSDRYLVSKGSRGGGDLRGAGDVWQGAFTKTSEDEESAQLWGRKSKGEGEKPAENKPGKRWRLDNYKNPQTPAKKDDCVLQSDPDRDYLNWAYSHPELSRFRTMLSSMKSENAAAEESIASLWPGTKNDIGVWHLALEKAAWEVWETSATFS